MKKFLIRLAIFGVIVLPFFLLVPYATWREWQRYLQSLTICGNHRVLVCGHSQVQTSLNPEHFPELINLSESGCPIEITCIKINDFVKINEEYSKLVIIDISPLPARASAFDFTVEPSLEVHKKYQFLYWLHHLNQFKPFPYQYAISQVKDIFSQRSTLAGGFDARSVQAFVQHPDRAYEHAAEQVQLLNHFGEFSPDNFYFRQVRDLLRSIAEVKQQAVLITTPLHNSLLDKWLYRGSFEKAVQVVAKDSACIWLNYIDVVFPDDQWYDANHLNVHGSEAFSQRVREDLRLNGLLPNVE